MATRNNPDRVVLREAGASEHHPYFGIYAFATVLWEMGSRDLINKVEICGINTSKLKVLKESEKLELLKRVKAGDEDARHQLVNGNLRLVLSVVQKFTNRGENLDDLFQVGCIGLIKSIDNFDISQNVRFSTYAVPMNVSGRNSKRKVAANDEKAGVNAGLRDVGYIR